MVHHEENDPFRVRLERIGKDGLDLREVITPDWVATTLGPGTPFIAAQGGTLDVHLERLEDVVHVRGRAHLDLTAACARCLQTVELALDTPIQVAIFPEGAEPAPGPDGELDEEAMGVATYRDHAVDLAGLIHDEIFLELPMNPVCSEGCLGLCKTCGVDRNTVSCDCQQEPEGRFHPFRNLKLS